MKEQIRISVTPLLMVALSILAPGTVSALDANLENGVLSITGDDSNESVEVTGDGSGVLNVKGGRNTATLVGDFSDVTSILIDTAGGNNRVFLNEVTVPGSVSVMGGNGRDNMRLTGLLSVGEDLVVDLAAGKNSITMSRTATISATRFASFSALDGNDSLLIPSISTEGHLTIQTAGGNDRIILGKNNKFIVSVGGRLTVAGGDGRNTINISGASVVDAIRLLTGQGNDSYTVRNSSTGSFLDLNSGGGRDRISSRSNSVATDYNVHCGSGRGDRLTARQDSASVVLSQLCTR